MTRHAGRPPSVRRAVLRAAQVAIAGAILWFAADRLAEEWDRVRPLAADLTPDWAGVVGSAGVVFATYALLVQSWRVLLSAWGDRLPFGVAVCIWSVSNLGRYVPGKLWSIGAMGVLAQRAGVSPVAATGSAVIGTLVNLAASLIVVCVAGQGVVEALFPHLAGWSGALPVAGVLGAILVPLVVPLATGLFARLTGRSAPTRRLPFRTLGVVVVANVASWLGYGLAFRWLCEALTPSAGGDPLAYVAVFAGSYLAGYLALVVPGGLGVREVFLVAGLTGLHLADAPTATLLAVASRLWLTVLELAPGLAFLAVGAARPLSRPAPDANA